MCFLAGNKKKKKKRSIVRVINGKEKKATKVPVGFPLETLRDVQLGTAPN